jgi:hypothetical protein
MNRVSMLAGKLGATRGERIVSAGIIAAAAAFALVALLIHGGWGKSFRRPERQITGFGIRRFFAPKKGATHSVAAVSARTALTR